MYDGSQDSIEENLKKTKEIVEMAHAKGITVEAEVGAIGGEEDGKLAAGECCRSGRVQKNCRDRN